MINFKILIFFMVLFVLPMSASALPLPSWYEANYDSAWCERIAKDFQKEYGGNLISLVPLLKNGDIAYLDDSKRVTGHMINKIYIKGNNQYFYIDYGGQRIMNTVEEVKEYYLMMTSNMLARDVGVYDLNNGEHPTIPMIWRT